MHEINSIYNKCFKYYIGNTKFVLYKKCVDFAYFTMHIISYNCTINYTQDHCNNVKTLFFLLLFFFLLSFLRNRKLK